MPAEMTTANAPVALPFAILDEEMAALRRFFETCDDGEGYDVPKQMMARLAEIGLIWKRRGTLYEATTFGLSVFNGDFAETDSATLAQAAPDAEGVKVPQELPVAEIIECQKMGQQTVKEIDGRWRWLPIGTKLYAAPTAGAGVAVPVASPQGEKA